MLGIPAKKFSHHPTGVTCAHVGWDDLEPIERMVSKSTVTRAELKNDCLLPLVSW